MVLQSTVFALITVAAVSVLVATLWMPVLQIYGSSMEPTLSSGEIVLSHKTSDMNTGDVIAFYYNNKILVKRVIGSAGDWIDIDDEGMVSVCGINQEGIDNAIKTIKLIVDPIEIGKTYEGEVVRIMPFGAFVQITPNKDGMIHISKLAKERVEKVEDVVNIGDIVRVKVLGIEMGKISLSLKDADN